MSVSHTVLSAVFSDESPAYRFPSEPDPGDSVAIRIRVAKDSARRIIVLFDSLTVGTLMVKTRSDDFFDYYEAGLVCSGEEIIYRFLIDCPDGTRIAYDKCGPGGRKQDAGIQSGLRLPLHSRLPCSRLGKGRRAVPDFHGPLLQRGSLQ